MTSAPTGLPPRARFWLGVQRAVCIALSPVTTLACYVLLRWWWRLRFAGIGDLRRAYRSFRRRDRAPLLICGNHLTMIDSALIAFALGSPLWYVLHPASMPWNVPDRNVFAGGPWQRALTYAFKCLPIERGGARLEVADALARFIHVLRRGEVGLIFPEGGRSRTGRVEVENAAYGVGRIVKSVPGCRVLCVYLRGDAQHGYGSLPARRDTVRTRIAWIEPKTDKRGLRGSLDISRQILARLAELEREHFDAVA